MIVVTPTEHPKLVRNRCVVEVFSGVFAFISDCIGAFVIRLSQISSFFSLSGKYCQ